MTNSLMTERNVGKHCSMSMRSIKQGSIQVNFPAGYRKSIDVVNKLPFCGMSANFLCKFYDALLHHQNPTASI
ncbi:unnamed protein product [Linum tenue]|uniref:Uncharacterized protein n=1 Tax=Linum tenue TaxID=586396 RepID=A0AAV0PYC6_9ROSI|nr:unnamed protein product [Linum tenue]